MIQFHKIWVEQCEATEGIRERFGTENALDYLIGEKLFHFVQASAQHPEFAAETAGLRGPDPAPVHGRGDPRVSRSPGEDEVSRALGTGVGHR